MKVTSYMTVDKEKKTYNQTDGLVWIKDRKVYVRNGKGGMPPVIDPCEEIELYVNGNICRHLTAVSEDDVIELRSPTIEQELQLEAEISEDELKCYLKFIPAAQVGYTINDCPPANKLEIKPVQYIIERRETAPQQILDFLDSLNIRYGVRMDVISEICKKNESGCFLVAEGQPPRDAQDDRIEYFFDISGKKVNKPDEDSLEKIDYKNIQQYETISAGQSLARIFRGDPGVNGISVTGDTIPPRPKKELRIIPSFSVRYDEETGTISANKTGRPICEERDNTVSFYIYDCIVLDEVSMRTGNVRFKGDIEIKTNVYESMEVAARQNVLVKGNVVFASIYAGNNITIKGSAISSKINAALNNVATKDPSPLIERLIGEINKLIGNLNQLPVPNMSQDQLNCVLMNLLNSKNKDLPSTIYEILLALKKDNYDIQDETILTLIKKTGSLMGNYTNIPDMDYLHHIKSYMATLLSGHKSTPVKGEITLNNITNCEVTALGNITVLGRGCINSVLYSKGKVFAKGLVRGGQIKAEKGIEINTAGTERGSRLLLEVPDNGYIKIQTVYSDTTVKVGPLSYTFLSKKNRIHARIENKKLIL